MKEIEKKIDVSKLVPAPLDNKNVTLDWWEDNMFDNGSYVCSENIYLGFITGVPVIATVSDNVVNLKCVPQPFSCIDLDKLDAFGNAVIKNMTGDECDLLTSMIPANKQFIDDDREEDMKLLISFSIYREEATISFHWNVPND